VDSVQSSACGVGRLREAIQRGVFFRALPGDVIAMWPPLVVTEAQADRMVEALRGALNAVADSLSPAGGA
jgi:adenosylmethionine-8-amino-7-oxononanoate aminotransferase